MVVFLFLVVVFVRFVSAATFTIKSRSPTRTNKTQSHKCGTVIPRCPTQGADVEERHLFCYFLPVEAVAGFEPLNLGSLCYCLTNWITIGGRLCPQFLSQ
jgi:hypothetical protein